MNSQKKRYVVSGLSVAYVLFLVYLFLVWGRGPIFQELPISEYAKTYVNVIPFKTTVEQLRNLNAGLINTEIVLANTLGHILAFFPMGALLALAYERTRQKHLLLVSFFSLLLELIQLVLHIGSFDVDAIIFNVLGYFVGLWFTKAVTSSIKRKQTKRGATVSY
ncbi:MAG: VanZ family protein [Acutalibacteraceae bacterium]|nr:VanZ family protein [Clostridia bacterium]MEE3373937.1 VanZ family protein [Acutalibacteraceae bacterium]